MRSLRLDAELEGRIVRAAAATGESVSAFVRRAAGDRADAVLATDARDGFADVIGVVRSDGGRARRTGEAFAEIVAERGRSGSRSS